MIRKVIELSCEASKVRCVISKLLRKTPPKGKVLSNHFTIYKRIANSSNRVFLIFCIHGKIHPVEAKSKVSYWVLPPLPALPLLALLWYGLVYNLANDTPFCSSEKTVWIYVVALCFCTVVLFWQMLHCEKNFRSFLIRECKTGDGQNH